MSLRWRGRTAPWMHAATRAGLAFAAGAVLNLAFAPFGWWPAALFAPAVLFALIRGLPPRRALGAGGTFGLGLFGFGTYWLYTCLHVFGLVPVWLTLLLQAALVAVMAAYAAALCYLANRFWLKSGATRDWLVLPALWLLLEWLRGWLFSGFPWLSLGYAFIDSPLAGWAPLFGVYGVTWAAAVCAAAINVLWTPPLTFSRRLAALGAVAALFALGALLARQNWTRPLGSPVSVAAVQGAVPQDQKWQLKNRALTLDRYVRLTGQAWGAGLIVWPESSLPALSIELTDYLGALKALGRAHGADFAIGLDDYWPKSKQYFNGILVLGESGDGWYYKRH
ncbi:MAG TPA: apolipoprotein N-acyltransferase, partial [Steroidobacteraceae bacterium]